MRNSIGKIASAFETDGLYHHAFIFKSAITAPLAAGGITDCSMSGGTPKYNAYVGSPLTATPMIGSGNNGIFFGTQAPDGSTNKHLLHARLAVINGAGTVNTAGTTFALCDYVMYYPLVDLDDTEEQLLDNTLSLPRYTSGIGLQMFMVCSVPSVANTTAIITYVDGADIERNTTITLNAANANQVISGQGNVSNFFIDLVSNFGVKYVTKVKLSSGIGGFATLVICKPITLIACPEQRIDSEITFVNDKLTIPKIEQGAYLNLLTTVTVTGTIQVIGEMLFVELQKSRSESVAVDPTPPPFSFVPTDLSGLELWLKADAGVIQSGTVSAWLDQSGNARHPTVIASPTYTASGLNGLPVINFNGTTQYLTLPSTVTTSLGGKSGCEVVMVFRRNNSTRLDPLIDLGLNSSTSLVYAEIPANDLPNGGGRSSLLDSFNGAYSSTAFIEDNYEMVSFVLSPANAYARYYLNNTLNVSTSGTFSQTTFVTSAGTDHALFAYLDGTATADISVAEVILYSQELSNTNKDKVAWYLNNKYNIGASYIVGDPSL